MATLKQLIAADIDAVVLNQDDFAEAAVYTPKSGSERTISAVIEEVGSFREGNRGKDSVEFIDVTVSRDSTTGIDNPQLGDALQRENDPPDKAYSYTGEKSNVDESAWVLRFTRNVRIEHGGNRRQ